MLTVSIVLLAIAVLAVACTPCRVQQAGSRNKTVTLPMPQRNPSTTLPQRQKTAPFTSPAEQALFRFEEQVSRPYASQYRASALHRYLDNEKQHGRLPWIMQMDINRFIREGEEIEQCVIAVRRMLRQASQFGK